MRVPGIHVQSNRPVHCHKTQAQLDGLDSNLLRSGAEQLSQQLQRLNAQLDDSLGAPSPLPAPVRFTFLTYACAMPNSRHLARVATVGKLSTC